VKLSLFDGSPETPLISRRGHRSREETSALFWALRERNRPFVFFVARRSCSRDFVRHIRYGSLSQKDVAFSVAANLACRYHIR